ncbi:MAG TPA: hypothetical protein VGR16_00045 [Thermomicrobiales bacterium]|nr:hypothetical protein [Thermomicrobiales bacterium]
MSGIGDDEIGKLTWDKLARAVTAEIEIFARMTLPGNGLRSYQLGPARAIIESVEGKLGRQFAIVFSRQSGKDEVLAQMLAYLLVQHQHRGGGIVLAAPTFLPQAALSRDRLLSRLNQRLIAGEIRQRDGYTVQVGKATARFLSASPTANARGQTADLLLVANEAQDIDPAIWDAVFDPMAASTNATTVFSGTVWDRAGLLHRQMTHLADLEARDGHQRVWRVPWGQVAAELPAYGERVRARIAQLGVDHPFVRTEYCLEPLDGEGGLFPPHRLAQMQGTHPRQHRAKPGRRYALLLDVAGEEEGASGLAAFNDDGRRDSTALTVVEVTETARGEDGETARGENGMSTPGRLPVSPSSRLPTYRVVDRMAWTGMRHTALHTQLIDLARNVWRANVIVVDATGIGAGLASFLTAELARSRIRVLPFVFTASSKSMLGWDFIGLIDAGRFKEYVDDGDALTRQYQAQLAATTYETVAGPGHRLRWSVPAGRGHDDLMISAALAATLDTFDWRPRRAIGSGAE